MPKRILPVSATTVTSDVPVVDRKILHLLPPQRVVGSDQIAPLQYRLEDAARLLAVSKRTLERWIQQGRASATGRSKLRRMEYSEILRLLNELRREGEAA